MKLTRDALDRRLAEAARKVRLLRRCTLDLEALRASIRSARADGIDVQPIAAQCALLAAEASDEYLVEALDGVRRQSNVSR